MLTALRFHTTVQQDGKIQVVADDIPSGETVEVIVLRPKDSQTPRRSVLDILNDAPGHRLFRSAEEVDRFLEEERESWDR